MPRLRVLEALNETVLCKDPCCSRQHKRIPNGLETRFSRTVLARDRGNATGMGDFVTGPGLSRI